jgi:hypothetical protein
LFTAALLAFFFPIASLQLPIVGNIDASGYDFYSKAREFDRRLENLKAQAIDEQVPPAETGRVPSQPIPLSIETAAFLPIEILGSFCLAGAALLLCIVGAGRGAVKASSTISGILAIAAILHIVVIDSDLHSLFQTQMQANSADLKDNPFAGFAQGLAALISNSVHFKPGAGLYALAATASLGALILHSGIVQQLGVGTDDVQPSASGSQGTRLFVFCIVAVLVVASGLLVLRHRPSTSGTSAISKSSRAVTGPSVQSLPSSQAESMDERSEKSRLLAALTEISGRQGHNHLYTACGNDSICVMDVNAPEDGFIENFSSNRVLAHKLYEVGFRSAIIANGNHAWGNQITLDGFVPIPDTKAPSDVGVPQ